MRQLYLTIWYGCCIWTNSGSPTLGAFYSPKGWTRQFLYISTLPICLKISIHSNLMMLISFCQNVGLLHLLVRRLATPTLRGSCFNFFQICLKISNLMVLISFFILYFSKVGLLPRTLCPIWLKSCIYRNSGMLISF